MCPGLVGKVKIFLSFQDESLILPLQDFFEKLENFGSFFRKVDCLIFSRLYYLNIRDQGPSFNEWFFHEIFSIELNDVKDVNKKFFAFHF